MDQMVRTTSTIPLPMTCLELVLISLSQEADQRPSLSVLEKSSTVGILLSLSSIRVPRLILTAHPTLSTVVPSPGLQLVVSLSHSPPMLTSTSRLLNATEFQSSLNTRSSQLPLLCSQADACTSTPMPPRRRLPHWSSPARMRIESTSQDSTTSQLCHATLMNGSRRTSISNITTLRTLESSRISLTNGSFASNSADLLFATGPPTFMDTLIQPSPLSTPSGGMMAPLILSRTSRIGVPNSHTPSIPSSGLRF